SRDLAAACRHAAPAPASRGRRRARAWGRGERRGEFGDVSMKFLLVVWEAAGSLRLRLGLALGASTVGTVGVLAVINSVLSTDEKAGEQASLGSLLLFVVV